MSPLRRHVAELSGTAPFKVALERGSCHVCYDFPQGFQGRGAERYDTGEIYVGEVRAHTCCAREKNKLPATVSMFLDH